ncbi:MAG: UTP--glucose-1-phosphate uridylyltransferase GalU [Methanomassiliicoccales archaeon]|jgi:UTP--glucose-1-phosphate uridylyltransferase|nr:UTP--glucose-1-phosphate uridylyltransferase GalU [Methanomassiliicoccales archaeon]
MKAVIPAAGLGVRFLPLTKAQPKEMLPVVDKPTIQYVVEEAIAAGISDIIIVTGAGKRAIEDHFDRSPELEAVLERNGKEEELQEIRRISHLAEIHYIRQKTPRGLGDAVYCARRHIGNEPFAVMLGDTINIAAVPVVKQLMDVHELLGTSVIAVERVPREKIRDYGIIKARNVRERLHLIEDLVEKPIPDQAPSDYGITGTYILTPSIFHCIEQTPAGRNGEIQLTDALRLLLREEKIYAYEFEGKRYDIGDKLGWMKTNLELILDHPEFSEETTKFLLDLLRRKKIIKGTKEGTRREKSNNMLD